MTNPPEQPNDGGYPSPQEGGYPPPPQGNYPPPPQGGYPPPPSGYPSQGGYPPPPQGGYPPPPQGNYPPPQGNYPPPPQGNYPPPPQGNYPPPPQGGYPPPPPGGYQQYGDPSFGGGQAFDIGTGVSWAWHKFTKNAAALIVPALVYAVIAIAISGVIELLATSLAPDSTSSYDSYDGGVSYSMGGGLGFASIVVLLFGYLVSFLVGGAISSAYYAGLLDIANGEKVSIGSFFKPRNVGSVLISSLLVGIAVGIGYLLCILPGLVVALFAIFSTVFIVDRNLPPIEAIKASFNIVKNNFVQVLLAALIIFAITLVGAVLCGIGLLVAAPVAALFLVYVYRQLSGGQVAPVTS